MLASGEPNIQVAACVVDVATARVGAIAVQAQQCEPMCATNGRHNKTSDITIESSQRLLKGGLPESLTAKPSVDMGGTSEWEIGAHQLVQWCRDCGWSRAVRPRVLGHVAGHARGDEGALRHQHAEEPRGARRARRPSRRGAALETRSAARFPDATALARRRPYVTSMCAQFARSSLF